MLQRSSLSAMRISIQPTSRTLYMENGFSKTFPNFQWWTTETLESHALNANYTSFRKSAQSLHYLHISTKSAINQHLSNVRIVSQLIYKRSMHSPECSRFAVELTWLTNGLYVCQKMKRKNSSREHRRSWSKFEKVVVWSCSVDVVIYPEEYWQLTEKKTSDNHNYITWFFRDPL